MKASAISGASDLLANRTQLKARLAKVSAATSLSDMLALLTGTGQEANVLQSAKDTVSGFLQAGIDGIETQLTALGVELDA